MVGRITLSISATSARTPTKCWGLVGCGVEMHPRRRDAHMRTREAQRSSGMLSGSRVLALAAMALALTFLVFSSSALASSSPPEVQTEPAEAIPGGAKLKGKLNPGGLP